MGERPQRRPAYLEEEQTEEQGAGPKKQEISRSFKRREKWISGRKGHQGVIAKKARGGVASRKQIKFTECLNRGLGVSQNNNRKKEA